MTATTETATFVPVRMRTIESLTDMVAKLLNQAENAGTDAESATFMAKAQKLATLHSIDLAKARHATIAKERTTPVQKTITLGVRGTRGLNTLVELFLGVARANDLTVDAAHNSTWVCAFGFSEDIDVAEALFASLSVQMAQAAAAYRIGGTWSAEKIYVPEHWRGSRWIEEGYKSPTWLTARLDFQLGFANAVGRRLVAARRDAVAGACAAEGEIASHDAGTELVLITKRDAIADHYKANSRARGAYRGQRKTYTSNAAWGAGGNAGRRAQLSAATAVGGTRKALA